MSFCGHIDTVRCPNCTPRVYEQQVPVDQVTTTTTTRPRDPRNVPPAQRLLREGGLCSCYWRLPSGRPVLCALPADEPHDHFLTLPVRGSWLCRTFGHSYVSRATTVLNETRWYQPVERPVTVTCRRCGDRP